MVIKPETSHVSPQLNMVFYDEFSTVTFMREGTIPPNGIDFVQRISQIGAPDHIDLRDTWFTTYLDEYTRKTPTQVLRVAPENNRNMITLSQSVQKV